MPTTEVFGLISFVGLVSQVAGALLLAFLFLLLRRHAERRPYFLAWANAWLLLAFGLAALAARSYVPGPRVVDVSAPVRAFFAAYQFGKLGFFALLLAGTLQYVRGLHARRFLPPALLVAGAYAALSVGLSPNLAEIIVWQAPLAAAVHAACAYSLLRLPGSRRSIGALITGGVFGLTSLQWCFYGVAFLPGTRLGLDPIGGPFALFVHYNSYFDLLLQMLLGYGMVVILMEDAKREADDAHAELAVAHDELRRVSLYDSLTGSLNRRAFAEGVGLERARAAYGTIVVLDMDNLKPVNDAFGHAAGDALLRHLADVLRAGLRPTDRLFRWGGDEFLVAMPGARSAVVLPRLEARLAGALPLRIGEAEIPLRVSFGAADFESAEELEAAVLRADSAMYRQKSLRRAAADSGSAG